jgi:hypothetical protein
MSELVEIIVLSVIVVAAITGLGFVGLWLSK